MEYKTFKSFYPFYLSQHKDVTCRRLHFVGMCFVLGLILTFILTLNGYFLLFMPIFGYGFAWIGHYFFEKNQPATFKYPLLSLRGDFKMFKDMLTGKIPF